MAQSEEEKGVKARKEVAGLHGWIDLGSDVNWEDYHGMWGRKAKDGSWYVLVFTNMFDAAGRRDCKRDGIPQYECQVKRIDLEDMPPLRIFEALRSAGMRPDGDGLVTDSGDEISKEQRDEVVVYVCIQHGLGAPLETFTRKNHPAWCRAEARRYAERCMQEPELLKERLERPVNAICTSAENYGKGRLMKGDP
jgi:hypothetical protein